MKIEGIVTNIVYRNEDNGYNIIVVETSDSDITCVGTMPFFDEGDNVEIDGELVYHDKYGEQINVKTIKLINPKGKDAIINFLSNSNIKGIGKRTAKQIYEKFGEDSIDIVYNEADKLKVIPGIGDKKILDIKETSEVSKDSRNTMLYLQSLNISYNLSMKICKLYGENTVDIIKSNPYKLVDDISGVGFAMADNIARNMQMESNSKFRISAGISHILNYEAEFNGHTSLKLQYLINKVSYLIKVSDKEICNTIKEDSLAGKLVIVVIDDQEYVYKSSLYKAEKYVAMELSKKKDSEYIFEVDIDEDLSAFSKEQQLAINEAFKNMLLVITGGPGTGKTTIINAIKKILNKNNLSYVMLAPTGRAAKRIQESTNDEAYTIHRLLGIKPDEAFAEYNEENPIEKDYIIVDEMSMVDIYLMKSLISAIAPTTALILVGDSNQLPSVGPGNVLKDIIETDINTIKLKKIFRQGLESNIIVNAHKINNGEYPILNEAGKDFFFIEANKNNFDKINDKKFRISDKVMQIRNNYDLVVENSLSDAEGVYNGDIGFIIDIDNEEYSLEVEFYDGSIVKYKKEDIKDLDLSYAITIHKSQGSEFEAVIIPMMQVSPMLLTRNLFYTGVTRAKKIVVLVGEKRIIKQMVDNNTSNKRFTNLSYWINEMETIIGD